MAQKQIRIEMKLTFKVLLLLFSISFAIFADEVAPLKLKVVSYNLRNFDYDVRLGSHTDKELLAQTLKTIAADLYAFQEVVNKPEFTTFAEKAFPNFNFIVSNCGGFGRQSLAFLYNPEVLELLSYKEDERLSRSTSCGQGLRPALIAHFKLRASNLTFFAINNHLKAGGGYLSEATRKDQYDLLSQIITELGGPKDENFILLGDFNTTSFLQNSAGNENFLKFLDDNTLKDQSTPIGCTSFWRPVQNVNNFVPSILDHIMISTPLMNQFKKALSKTHAHCEALKCKEATLEKMGDTFKNISDHCPIATTLE